MTLKRSFLLLAMVLCVCMAWAQSQAAFNKLLARYSPEELEDMRERTNYKYEGLLLFYSESFLVKEDGVFRTATEAEIAAIDLDAYTGSRAEVEDVVVFDNELGTDVLLRSRDHFEEIYLSRLNAHDRSAYHAYKASAQSAISKIPR